MIDPAIRLIAICGPTASGKSELALNLAEQFNGEIVCADSRTIYRGMDIGTAKPTFADQQRVPHHLLDIIDPNKTLSAGEFKRLAEEAISSIAARGKVPFLVGGSGLYLYGVVYDYQFPAGPDNELRRELETKSLAELVAQLEEEDPELANQIDLRNRRRVVRALETMGQPRLKQPHLPVNILLLGLRHEEASLNKNITQRTKHMFQIGLVKEVEELAAKYGQNRPALASPGYAETLSYSVGDIDLVDTEQLINVHTRQLVKRQLTWYRRNPEIRWLEDGSAAHALVADFLETSTTKVS